MIASAVFYQSFDIRPVSADHATMITGAGDRVDRCRERAERDLGPRGVSGLRVVFHLVITTPQGWG
jgi:hypothetical protein